MTDDIDLFEVQEIELHYKNKISPNKRLKISDAKDAYHVFMKSWDDNKIDFVEQAKVVLLNRNNQLLGVCEVSTGGVSGTILDPKIVFAAALKANASAFILAHNHPSGNLSPSLQDKQITRQFIEAGKVLCIEILDHLIVSRLNFFSFASEPGYDMLSF